MQTKKRKKRKHLFVIELVLPTINLTQRKVLSMFNSIQHFIEKGTYEIEDTMREFVEGTLDIDAYSCLLYTSPSPRDSTSSRMPSSA